MTVIASLSVFKVTPLLTFILDQALTGAICPVFQVLSDSQEPVITELKGMGAEEETQSVAGSIR